MTYEEVQKIIEEREGERKAALSALRAERDAAKDDIVKYDSELNAALDLGKVDSSTAELQMKKEAATRRANKASETIQNLKAVPLFSIQEVNDIQRETGKEYAKAYGDTASELRELIQKLESVRDELKEKGNDEAHVNYALRRSIEKMGYKIPEYKGRNPKAFYHFPNHNRFSGSYGNGSTEEMDEGIRNLKEFCDYVERCAK